MLESAESQVPKLIIRKIIFEEFQRMSSQSTNVTDGQTDGRTDRQLTIRNASCGKNESEYAAISWKR